MTGLRIQFVPHDIAKIISLLGGEETFLKRLDFFHTSGISDIGNEPVFLTVYMPHYAGRPGLSTKRAHYCMSASISIASVCWLSGITDIPSRFNDSLAGLPGNDDSGAMASFTLLSTIGLFPNPGQNIYFISAPFFKRISITSPATNKTAIVEATNFDAGYKNIYIQSAKVNGEVYTKNWIGHEFFSEGWKLELVLGPEESTWGTAIEDRPPSVSNEEVSEGYGVDFGLDFGMHM